MKLIRNSLLPILLLFVLVETARPLYWIKMEPKYVALTFDDGPRPIRTAQLLDTLRRYHVKATFFVVGHMAQLYPTDIKSMVAEGHEVANHTWSHRSLKLLSHHDLLEELQRTQDFLLRLTGKSTWLFRPPGSTRAVLNQLVPPLGYSMVLWDVHSQDHLGIPSEKIAQNVLRSTKNGDIILLHNGLPNTIMALDEIIPELKKRGFEFVSVSELMDHRHPISSIVRSSTLAEK